MKDALRRLNSQIRSTTLRRFAFGTACGIVLVLGMWLISTLSHNEKYNLGLTWPLAVTIVLFMGLLGLRPSRKSTE